jgi:hypothetical protein
MPEVRVIMPLNVTTTLCVAEESIAEPEHKGFYVRGYCDIREEPVAIIFHRTRRTDYENRPVYVLVGIRPLADLQREAEAANSEGFDLDEMPTVGKGNN